VRVYVSSTYEDLHEHRNAVARVLRQLGHEVAAMEEYVAEGTRPLAKVLEDVAASDVYVGLFAWRYGYVPATGPAVGDAVPGESSITEYEYRQALASGKPVVIFLLNERVAWPVHYIDRDPVSAEALRQLREELQREHLVSFFDTPEALATQVAVAVSTQGLRDKVRDQLISPVGAQLMQAFTMGGTLNDSHTMPIMDLLTAARPEQAVAIDISTLWWSTRLYLLAALGQQLGMLQRIVIFDGDAFVGLISTTMVRNTLRRIHAQANRFEAQVLGRATGSDISRVVQSCIDRWNALFASHAGGESEVVEQVTVPNLRLWFGEALQDSPVAIANLDAATAVDLLRILDYPNDFVPVLESGPDPTGTVRLIDKRRLQAQVARSAVVEMLDRRGGL
jgi:hypothetical protein